MTEFQLKQFDYINSVIDPQEPTSKMIAEVIESNVKRWTMCNKCYTEGKMNFKIVRMKVCPRCGESHHNLPAYKLTNPTPLPDGSGNFINYWAMCPVLKEPLLTIINQVEV